MFIVLINGIPSTFFNSSCGLKQEDPLSTLLFIVVMEASSKWLSDTMDRGLLLGFLVGSRNNDELHLSHLLFASSLLML